MNTPKNTRLPTGHIAPFGLRLQPEIKERLEIEAAKAGRSLNSEISARLQNSFKGGASEAINLIDLYHQMRSSHRLHLKARLRYVEAGETLFDSYVSSLKGSVYALLTAQSISDEDKKLIDGAFSDEGYIREFFADMIADLNEEINEAAKGDSA